MGDELRRGILASCLMPIALAACAPSSSSATAAERKEREDDVVAEGEHTPGTFTSKSIEASGRCLDIPDPDEADGASVIAYVCRKASNQRFSLSAEGTLTTRSGKCVEARSNSVILKECGSKAGRWTYQANTLRALGGCLTVNQFRLALEPCVAEAAQNWTIR